MSTYVTLTKQEVIDRLEGNIRLAEIDDQNAKEQHEQDEQEFLELFRERCREAVEWDYHEAKRQGFDINRWDNKIGDPPNCPLLSAKPLKAMLDFIKVKSDNKPIRVTKDSELSRMLFWLPKDKRIPNSVCDDD